MNKKTTSHGIFTFLFGLGVIVSVFTGVRPPLVCAEEKLTLATNESRLWLSGNSTLHKYSSTATVINAIANLSSNRSAQETAYALIESNAVNALSLRVPVASLKSHSGLLDKKMRACLKIESDPEIAFQLSGYKIIKGKSGDTKTHVVGQGDLSVAGTTRKVEINALLIQSGEQALLCGTKELFMSDFGITPPTLMMGSLKTEDKVVIGFNLMFIKSTIK